MALFWYSFFLLLDCGHIRRVAYVKQQVDLTLSAVRNPGKDPLAANEQVTADSRGLNALLSRSPQINRDWWHIPYPA